MFEGRREDVSEEDLTELQNDLANEAQMYGEQPFEPDWIDFKPNFHSPDVFMMKTASDAMKLNIS